MKNVLTILTSLMITAGAFAQSGHVMNGVGPIDQGLAGASMAAPQDALTALHWNPASIPHLPGQSIDAGLQLMMPSGTIESSVQQDAFGPLGPPATLSGSTDSEAGPFPIPSLGYVNHKEGRPFAFGVSAFGVGGFGVDYEQSSTNPILTPQMPDGGMGFGAMSSTFMLLQISPSVAYQVNEYVSVGAAPTINFASLNLSVFPATAPTVVGTMPDGTPLAKYPDAPTAWATGFGFQAGVQTAPAKNLSVGLSFKSKQFFNDFEFSPDLQGAADYTFRLDYPMILSAGAGYEAVDGLLFVADVRYIDFENAEGFDNTGFDATGAVQGFGWESIVVAAFGAQYDINEQFAVRAGYGWNENPITGETAFYNSPAPALITNRVAGGFTWKANTKVAVSFAGQYGLSSEVSGEWKNPMFPDGTNPFTSVTHELSTLTLIAGLHVAI